MSWWQLPGDGAQEQYMGDPLADAVTEELLELVTARRERGESLPRAEELAAAIDVELEARPLRVGDASVLSGCRVGASGLPPRWPPDVSFSLVEEPEGPEPS